MGAYFGAAKTFREIAEILTAKGEKISKQRVHEIHDEAIEKLRRLMKDDEDVLDLFPERKHTYILGRVNGKYHHGIGSVIGLKGDVGD